MRGFLRELVTSKISWYKRGFRKYWKTFMTLFSWTAPMDSGQEKVVMMQLRG